MTSFVKILASLKPAICLFVLFGSVFIASDCLPPSSSLIMHSRPLSSSVSASQTLSI